MPVGGTREVAKVGKPVELPLRQILVIKAARKSTRLLHPTTMALSVVKMVLGAAMQLRVSGRGSLPSPSMTVAATSKADTIAAFVRGRPNRTMRRIRVLFRCPRLNSPPFALAQDDSVMGTYGRFSLVVSHGEGCCLFDTDGKRYLDFAAGISTCCLGHADPRLVSAVAEQMGRVHHVSNLYYIPQQGELARRLVETSCADRAFFCNSGAEVRLLRALPRTHALPAP